MKINFKHLFILLSMILLCSCNIQGVQAQTQAEMHESAYQIYKQKDKELNYVYNKILIKYKNDKIFISKLRKAELAWIQFKNAQLESLYPADDKSFYGSAYPICINMAAAEITQERINQLKLWLDGTCEGVCSGSIPHKAKKYCK